MNVRSKLYRWFCAILLLPAGALLLAAGPSGAVMRPDQLILVVNKAVPEGLRMARYYSEKRRVPPQNILVIETSAREDIDRDEYEKEIAAPIRKLLLRNDPEGHRFSCLVLFKGIPLRVGPPRLSVSEGMRMAVLQKELSDLMERKTGKETKGLQEDIVRIEKEISQLGMARQGASVDSEIALVMENKHPLKGWLPNRYFVGFRGKNVSGMPQRVLAVCRLDGPTEAVVYRIIDDSLFAEDHGLAGKAYLDARWPDKNGKDLSFYQVYDRAIHHTARLMEKNGRLPVVLDERETLFQPGTATDAALYLGWYSLGKYVDAFTWARGAVGFHVASSECTTLKAGASTVWCKTMLEKGVAATLGPVAEPYLQSFPAPEVFFGCLLSGGTLVECYTVANPFWSWQMVLIGDPLYHPFRPFLEKRE
ncbi:MAG: hypothetical protein A4E57_00798 [Syntrophorhabdaceae bacterium PtaU1.Bin034]|nr:MAG: hypothetical protein A4E57_00798 [Syntrophorhabdaceae bacterium PtaU1.Bin034]